MLNLVAAALTGCFWPITAGCQGQKSPLNSGLRKRLFLWREAQTLAEFVLQLSTNVRDNVFPGCRACISVDFLLASFDGLSGLSVFLAL
jgi:hypothetical protein